MKILKINLNKYLKILMFVIFIFTINCFSTYNIVFAGKLGDFKKRIPNREPRRKNTGSTSSSKSSDVNIGDTIEGFCMLAELSAKAVVAVGSLGMAVEDNYFREEAVHENSDLEDLRLHFRFGVDTQYINKNIYGYSIYGRFSLFTIATDIEFIEYTEDLNPGIDKLNILNTNFGYNLKGKDLNLFIGAGTKSFGDNGLESAFQMALVVDGRLLFDSLRYEAKANIGFLEDITIHDYKGGFALKIKRFEFKAGYRTIFLKTSSEISTDISGPYIGLMYNF